MNALDAAALQNMFQQVLLGGLLFVRVLGLLLMAPVLGFTGIPPIFKVSFAAMIAIALLPTVPPQPPLELHPFALAPLVLKESFVGLFIGFVASSVLYAARFAGGLIDVNTGFQTALFFEPNLGGFPTLVGEFFAFATMMLFFGLDGPRVLLTAFAESVQLIPLTSPLLPLESEVPLVAWVGGVTTLAFSIAAPVLAAQFLAIWALALLARTAPQMNIFMLSFSVKVIVGLGMLVVGTPLMVILVRAALHKLTAETLLLIRSLVP